MTISSWRRNWAVRRRILPPVLAISPLWERHHSGVPEGRSGVLLPLPATRLWRPDSQSAPRHRVSRVSMCLPGAAQTVPLERFLGPEQLNAVNPQKIYCRVSPRGKFSAAAAEYRWGGLGERLGAY